MRPTDERIMQLYVACGALAVLTVCALAGPDPDGLGTHSRLLLPRCAYLERTGRPCVACGGVTAACWFARGHPVIALRTHPAGFAVACVLAFSIPLSLISALARWRWSAHLRRVRAPVWTALVCAFLGLLLIGWPGRVERYLSLQREFGGADVQKTAFRAPVPSHAAVHASVRRDVSRK